MKAKRSYKSMSLNKIDVPSTNVEILCLSFKNLLKSFKWKQNEQNKSFDNKLNTTLNKA